MKTSDLAEGKQQDTLFQKEMESLQGYLKMAKSILHKPRGERCRSLRFLIKELEYQYSDLIHSAVDVIRQRMMYFENGIPVDFTLTRFLLCMRKQYDIIDKCVSHVRALMRQKASMEEITDSQCLLLVFFQVLMTDYQYEFSVYIRKVALRKTLKETERVQTLCADTDFPLKKFFPKTCHKTGIQIVTDVSYPGPGLNHFVQRFLKYIDNVMAMPYGKAQLDALIKLKNKILQCELPSWIREKPDVQYGYVPPHSEIANQIRVGYFDFARFKELMESPLYFQQKQDFFSEEFLPTKGEQAEQSDAEEKLVLMIAMLNEEILVRQEMFEILSETPKVEGFTHFSMTVPDDYLKDFLDCLKRNAWVVESTKAEDWICRLTGRLPDRGMPSPEPIQFAQLNQCRYVLKYLVCGGARVSEANYKKAAQAFSAQEGDISKLKSANKNPSGSNEIDKLLKKRPD